MPAGRLAEPSGKTGISIALPTFKAALCSLVLQAAVGGSSSAAAPSVASGVVSVEIGQTLDHRSEGMQSEGLDFQDCRAAPA